MSRSSFNTQTVRLRRSRTLPRNTPPLEAALTGRVRRIRPAYSTLPRHIAESGSRVSAPAERAQMTKQGMDYLANSLASAGYLKLEPDPSDGRAKLARLIRHGPRGDGGHDRPQRRSRGGVR